MDEIPVTVVSMDDILQILFKPVHPVFTPNFIILEFGQDHLKPKAEFVDKAWAPVNGYLELPTKPGIGMELNLEAISAASGHPWDRGFPKHIDGSPAFI